MPRLHTMTVPDFKYDIALSLLDQDRSVAIQLHERLCDRLKVFLYSERPEELVGTDGMETFRKVFRHEARVVVVLYRPGWGETRWTRVEQTAIRERAWDEGWDFLQMILMDPPSKPVWLHETYIWGQLKEYGFDGAAAIIEEHVRRAGGQVRTESVVDRVQRLARAATAAREREVRERSTEGVEAAEAEMGHFEGELQRLAQKVAARSGDMPAEFERTRTGVLIVRVGRYCTTLGWTLRYLNTVEGAELLLQEWDYPKSDRGRHMMDDGSGPRQEYRFEIRLDEADAWVWREVGGQERCFSTRRLADHVVKSLIDRAYGNEPPGTVGLFFV